MPRELLPVDELLAALAGAPSQIAALTADRSPAQLRKRPGPEEWSANEVLAHLRSCSDVWGAAMARIANENRPTIRAVNPRTWIEGTDYLDLEFRPSLRLFTKQRGTLLKLLRALGARGWSRSAILTGAGSPLHPTIHLYADRMVRHERTHLGQMARIAGAFRARR